MSLGVIGALVLSLVLPTNVAYADEVSTESEVVVTANEESYVETVSESEKAAAEKTEGETSESKKEDSEKIEESDDKKVEEQVDESKKEDSEKLEETDDKKVEEKADESKKEDSEEVEKTEEKETKTELKEQDSEETEEFEENIEDEEELEDEAEDESVEAVLGETLLSLEVTSSNYYTLSSDTVIKGNVYITGGMLTLDGYELKVEGNIINSGGYIYMTNSSRLCVSGDLIFQKDLSYLHIEESECIVDGNLFLRGGDVTLNDNVYMEIKGDFIGTGGNLRTNIVENQPTKLVVGGKLQMSTGELDFNHQLDEVEVNGNVELQADDGNMGSCVLEVFGSGFSVKGDFIVNTELFLESRSDRPSVLISEAINLGGNYIDKVGMNFNCIRGINLTGDKIHIIDMLENSSIGTLVPDGGEISVVKYFNVLSLGGSAVVSSKNGKIISKKIGLNGYTLTVTCAYEVSGEHGIDQDAGLIPDMYITDGSILNVYGDWICSSGIVYIDRNAKMNTRGNLKIQKNDGTTGSCFFENTGECSVDGDFIFDTNVKMVFSSQFTSKLNIKGDFINKTGINFPSTVNMLSKGKTITTTGGQIYILYLNGSRNDYNITTPNCWYKIYESANAGWKQDKSGWWYLNVDGTYPKSTWKLIDGKWYHFNANGYMQTGWIQDGSSWYYLESNGVMATSKWIDNTFYVKANGVMAVNEWIDDKYYVDNTGRWVPGKQKPGWKQDKTGWWYLNADGTYPRSCWKEIGGKWYHFNASGYMQTGWIMDGKVWYYLEANGAMATNKWIEELFYVKANGAMAVSEWVDGGKYYVDATGRWVPNKAK